MTAAPHYDWSFSFPRLRRELRAGSRDVLQQDQCPVYRWDPMPTGFKILYFLIPYSQQCSSALCPAVLLLSLVATSAFPVPVIWSRRSAIGKTLLPLAVVGLSLLDEHPALPQLVPSAQLLREPAFPKVLFDY